MKVITILIIYGLIGISLCVSGSEVIECAKKQLNKPYEWGATGPYSFDCSGLTYYCHGSSIPRTAAAQFSGGRAASGAAGDLVFFDTSGDGGISHVGICVGGGQMIHSGSKGVGYATYSGHSYWVPKLKGYKRYAS